MSNAEYVRLSGNEILYGEKNLLKSQLELADLLKKIKLYHKLRREELLLKIALRRKLEETSDSIKLFQKILPKTEADKPKVEKKKIKPMTLEQEIEDIKHRLDKL